MKENLKQPHKTSIQGQKNVKKGQHSWKFRQKYTKFENILKKGRWLRAIIARNKLLEKALHTSINLHSLLIIRHSYYLTTEPHAGLILKVGMSAIYPKKGKKMLKKGNIFKNLGKNIQNLKIFWKKTGACVRLLHAINC